MVCIQLYSPMDSGATVQVGFLELVEVVDSLAVSCAKL
jgi:hypothetical protein